MQTLRRVICLKYILLAIFCLPLACGAAQRSAKNKAEFVRLNPCPSTGSNKPYQPCPGYIVDHIRALACDGADHHANMQWQTVEDAKVKDRWETIGCRK